MNVATKNGQRIRFVHIDSKDDGGDGSFGNPLNNLNEIEDNSQEGDVIIVHAGSEFTNQEVVLQDRQQFLGEGMITLNEGDAMEMRMETGILIMTDNMGNMAIPQTAPGASDMDVPVIRNNKDVDVITLANFGNKMNTVAGFEIDGLGGPGTAISDPGGVVNDTTLRALVIQGFDGDGISLANGAGGMIEMTKLDLDNIGGNAILVNGAQRDSMVSIIGTTDGTVTINGAGGNAIAITEAEAGAMIMVEDVDIGLAKNGKVFTGNAGIFLDDNDIDSQIMFTDIEITTNGAKALLGMNIGTVEFIEDDEMNVLLAMNSGAIQVVGGAIGPAGWTFSSITATNTGDMEGIDIDDIDGFGNTFTVSGLTTIDTTGGTDVDGINIANSNATYSFMGGVDIDNTTGNGVTATNVEQLTIMGAPSTITGAGGDGIKLTDTNATLDMITIESPGGVGLNVMQTNGMDHTVTASNLVVDKSGAQGVLLTNMGAGDLTVDLDTITVDSNGTAIEGDVTGTGDLIFSLRDTAGDNMLGSTNGAGIDLDGSGGAGTLFVTALGGTTLIGGNTTTGGVVLDDVVFDAIAGGAVQTVTVDRLEIGTLASRVNGNGFDATMVRGQLTITDLDIANADGTGLLIKNAPADAFTFITGGGSTIDTLRGTAMDIDPVAADMNFTSVTSVVAGGPGIRLSEVTAADGTLDGNVLDITGTTTIRGTTGNGIEITDGVGTHTFADVDIEMTTGNGVFLQNLISSGTAPGMAIDDGVIINGGSIRSTMGSGVEALDVRSLLVQNVDIRSGDIGVDLDADGSVMIAQILNNGINTGMGGVFSLQADVSNSGTMCLDVVGNDDGAGNAPIDEFELNNNGPTSILGITQAAIPAMSAANNGVNVNDNGVNNVNCDLNNP